MSQTKLNQFFKKANSIEEITPPEWRNMPTPKRTPKRPVGRPQKEVVILEPTSPTPSPKRKRIEAAEERSMESEMEDCGLLKRGAYKSYSDKERRKVLELCDKFGQRPVSRRLEIAQSTISTWKTKGDDSSEREKGKRKPGGGRNLTYSKEIDDDICVWLLKQRENQLPVTSKKLRAYAQAVIRKENPKFLCSDGWQRGFFRRHNLTIRSHTSLSQKLPSDLEIRLTVFYTHLKEKRIKYEFGENMVINMDEVPMFFEMIPTKTIDQKGVKDVKVVTSGLSKRHCTLVLAVSSGGQTLPPMIIFKGKRLPKLNLPPGWLVRVNPTAWMNSELMVEWVREILAVFTKRTLSLVIFDSFSAHTTPAAQEALEIAIAKYALIPGGCTSKAQPLDVALNKPLKDQLRSQWVSFVDSKVAECVNTGIPIEKAARPTQQDVINWVGEAWRYIGAQRELIQKSFKVTGIANALNGAEDSMIRSDSFLGHSNVNMENEDDDSDFDGFLEDDVTCYNEDPFGDVDPL